MYERQLLNQAFARDYMIMSGRAWLANFPRRFPIHQMHSASYVGQKHKLNDTTLSVVSVVPKVFKIDNFLSLDECKEVIRLAMDQGLKPSTLHHSSLARQNRDNSTRSSTNAWLQRETSPVAEKIFKKAADITNIDSHYLKNFHTHRAEHNSIAESMQVVRYKKGEEYTPHHDFISPPISERYQASRFATLLIYLNHVKEGGETRFPKALNNYSSDGLELEPKTGTAILFYNMLEDGNFDDMSQHGSNKVFKGIKWLANLWVSADIVSMLFFCVQILKISLPLVHSLHIQCAFFTDAKRFGTLLSAKSSAGSVYI